MVIKPLVIAVVVLCIRACLPFLWEFSLNWPVSFFFLNFGMVLETLVEFAWQRQFFWKNLVAPENGLRIRFFEFIEKFGHLFFLDLVCNESLYFLLYSFTNPIFGKYGSWYLNQNALGQSDCRILEIVYIFGT